MAISAPELPAPTTSTPPSWIWDGLRILGMELDDARVELACERRDPGVVRGAGGHDHVFGDERVLATDHRKPIPDLGESVDFDPVRTGSSNLRAYASR